MRKREKNLMMEMLGIIEKAHEKINTFIIGNNIAGACQLLVECQKTAIKVGTSIEESEGLGFVTVGLLEDYCELLYAISEDLSESDNINPYNISQQLNQSMQKIKDSVDADIPLRKEVVFLPYKASMWDSLESVWKKCDADPLIDAYVIPIPYYDKNNDGSFKEEHWEGDQFPKDVPITKYEDYDFGKRHPDEIYIHNPYDEYNYVTSVHPFFYSKNILPHTDNLIYIPYFVLQEPDPNSPDIKDSIGKFASTPGVINATKVIVQSENMRQAYINALSQIHGEDSRSYWEQKIKGDGSPKIDKILSLKKEDQDIPEDWLKLMKKPDGSFKKIILYNTGLASFLAANEDMLEKIRDTFKVFKNHIDDVLLLWRPHPLMRATIESMRPQLLAEYDALVEEYKEEGFGIYDDTADMDRAIALSDAYYGDQSSLVELCRKRKMPIMIQNPHVICADADDDID